ncbi:MAG: hypothetical protein OEZ44_04865 [Candidatus Bathyarchaeota archaeon]|nr:hypothetical protein [Aigarchaeota archaeon]MDH5791496.1 hypothetical protein [Candidatus Bathyarchaeota archaeon]
MNGRALERAALLSYLLALCLYAGSAAFKVDASAAPIHGFEQVVHEGDLVLTGSETLAMDRVNYTQIGDIYIYDNATLRFSSSRLRLGAGAEDLFSISIKGSGSLELLDSLIEAPYWARIYMNDEARAYLNNGTVIDEHRIYGRAYYKSGFDLRGNSTIEAYNSRLGYVKLMENASCEIRDSFIGELFPISTALSAVSRSDIECLRLWFKDAELTISRGLQGHHEILDAKTAFGAVCPTVNLKLFDSNILEPPSIDLTNSSLDLQTDLTAVQTWNGSRVRVTGCHLWLLSSNRGETQIEVVNSTIDHLRCSFFEGNSMYSLKGSRIGDANLESEVGLQVDIEDCSLGYFEVFTFPEREPHA